MQPNDQQQSYQPQQAQMPVSADAPPLQPVAPQAQAPIGNGQTPPTPGQPAPTQGKQQPSKPTSTQNSLLLSEMRENMIIMNDGSFRAIVQCQSINFDLMSSREREAIEFSYQNFLNSLYFPIQVLVRSRRVDIGPYIDRLLNIRRQQDNMLLNVLMDDYINFIDVLAQEANIMDKSFYIVIPFYPTGDLNEIKKQAKGLFDSFFSGNKTGAITKIDQVAYEKAKDEIRNRVDSVINGLYQMGVKSVQLNTKQLGELFYSSYNPDTATREPMAIDPNELSSTYVRKGEGQAPSHGGIY